MADPEVIRRVSDRVGGGEAFGRAEKTDRLSRS
jgi:hypothetical protein